MIVDKKSVFDGFMINFLCSFSFCMCGRFSASEEAHQDLLLKMIPVINELKPVLMFNQNCI